MVLSNYRKETSERSDPSNWAKQLLIDKVNFHLDSIEGCNQNSLNLTTHLIERARVDYDDTTKDTIENVGRNILLIEGEDVLNRKVKFAKRFDLPLHYVLYCDETEYVYLFKMEDPAKIELEKSFGSYKKFSEWIKGIKGWQSSKGFREIEDLPDFDKKLRRAGTAWPTNLDCFVASEDNTPLCIIEFQNANKTAVANHCCAASDQFGSFDLNK